MDSDKKEVNKEENFIENARCKNCKYSFRNGNQLYCSQREAERKIEVDEYGNKKDIVKYQKTGEEEHCSFFDGFDVKEQLYEAYMNIQDILRKYCDLHEDQYHIITSWIIGTYLHDQFQSYPYLFLNAMRGSGKTRTMKLITKLAKDGEVLLSMTEAVLFRTSGTLGIDEFEEPGRKGRENLRELMNACYKKGSKVKRMKQKKGQEGETLQVVEEFDIYRPLVIANISGMEEVLGDRCIELILERSNNRKITQMIEIYEQEEIFKKTKEILNRCSLCSVVAPEKCYIEWNTYIYTNYINHNNYTNYTNYIELFKRLNLLDLNGRDLELTLPLLLIAWEIGEKSPEIFEKNYTAIKNYTKSKKEDQFNESLDISLIDFVSQYTNDGWETIKKLTEDFKSFIQSNDEEINSRWMGRALKRLDLKLDTRRIGGGVQVRLNIQKAQEKIKQFK